jgi:murein DD-endopeptidase MepM/ murein hydrolase activator NlpD
VIARIGNHRGSFRRQSLCALALLLAPTTAFAQGAVIITMPTPRTEAADPATPAVISIERAADITGATIQFSRSVFSGAPLSAPSRPVAPVTASGLPVSGYLTSRFGPRYHPVLGMRLQHQGVDVAAPAGTPIFATADGVVARAGWAGGYGLLVALDHGGGTETRFGHMSRIAVSPGERVVRGSILGYVGSTGLSTGPHVHYEVRVNGRAIDPQSSGGPGR